MDSREKIDAAILLWIDPFFTEDLTYNEKAAEIFENPVQLIYAAEAVPHLFGLGMVLTINDPRVGKALKKELKRLDCDFETANALLNCAKKTGRQIVELAKLRARKDSEISAVGKYLAEHGNTLLSLCLIFGPTAHALVTKLQAETVVFRPRYCNEESDELASASVSVFDCVSRAALLRSLFLVGNLASENKTKLGPLVPSLRGAFESFCKRLNVSRDLIKDLQSSGRALGNGRIVSVSGLTEESFHEVGVKYAIRVANAVLSVVRPLAGLLGHYLALPPDKLLGRDWSPMELKLISNSVSGIEVDLQELEAGIGAEALLLMRGNSQFSKESKGRGFSQDRLEKTLEYIKRFPGKTAKEIAGSVELDPTSFRKYYLPELKRLGVVSKRPGYVWRPKNTL